MDVSEILGFEVPRLLDFDDELLVLKITIVMPPFVLDFAGAYVDRAPEFSDEVWEEWTRKNEDNSSVNALPIYVGKPLMTRWTRPLAAGFRIMRKDIL